MDRWVGRVALVTGANSGIGEAIAKCLSQNGMKVIGADLNTINIKPLSSDEKGLLSAFQCDLTKDEQVESLFSHIEEKFGGIDVCVNCAGITQQYSLLEGNPKLWRKMLDINLVATCYCSKLSVDLMKKNNVDDGHIINIASVTGRTVSKFPALHFYSATKFGLTAFTDGLRQELRDMKSKIKVTCINPGVVRTNLMQNANFPADFIEKTYGTLAWIEPKDVADTILHVISTPPNVQINDLRICPTEELNI